MGRIDTITSIARPVDPRYPTNRAILAIALVATGIGVIYQIANEAGTFASIKGGALVGLSGFVAWALARELDPDHPYAAFVGTAIVFAGIVVYGLPGLMFSFWTLLSLRFVNRTCGPAATWLDSLLGLGLALWLVYQGTWVVGLAMTAAFLADALLAPANRRQFIFAGVSLLGTVVLTGVPTIQGPAASMATWGIVGVAVPLMLLIIVGSRSVHSVGDLTHERLEARRVQVAQSLGLATVAALVIVAGDDGFVAGLPVWAAMLGVGVYRVVVAAARRGR